MRLLSLLDKRLRKAGGSGSWMAALTDHGTHGTGGICVSTNPALSFLTSTSPPLRHLAIVGLEGHVATFDWQTGALHSELQLRETCRDITFVQQNSPSGLAD